MPPAGRFLKKAPQKLLTRKNNKKFFRGSRGAVFQKSPPGMEKKYEKFK
jgi:hypothetical protein